MKKSKMDNELIFQSSGMKREPQESKQRNVSLSLKMDWW